MEVQGNSKGHGLGNRLLAWAILPHLDMREMHDERERRCGVGRGDGSANADDPADGCGSFGEVAAGGEGDSYAPWVTFFPLQGDSVA